MQSQATPQTYWSRNYIFQKSQVIRMHTGNRKAISKKEAFILWCIYLGFFQCCHFPGTFTNSHPQHFVPPTAFIIKITPGAAVYFWATLPEALIYQVKDWVQDSVFSLGTLSNSSDHAPSRDTQFSSGWPPNPYDHMKYWNNKDLCESFRRVSCYTTSKRRLSATMSYLPSYNCPNQRWSSWL